MRSQRAIGRPGPADPAADGQRSARAARPVSLSRGRSALGPEGSHKRPSSSRNGALSPFASASAAAPVVQGGRPRQGTRRASPETERYLSRRSARVKGRRIRRGAEASLVDPRSWAASIRQRLRHRPQTWENVRSAEPEQAQLLVSGDRAVTARVAPTATPARLALAAELPCRAEGVWPGPTRAPLRVRCADVDFRRRPRVCRAPVSLLDEVEAG